MVLLPSLLKVIVGTAYGCAPHIQTNVHRMGVAASNQSGSLIHLNHTAIDSYQRFIIARQ